MRQRREISKAITKRDDMRSEYEFANMSGGMRGKYYKAYRKGHTVKIHQTDGRITVQQFKTKDGVD